MARKSTTRKPANIERAVAEARRRTTVLPQGGDDARMVTRVCVVLLRVSERWGKKLYRAVEQHQRRALRQAWGLDQPPAAPALVTMAAQPRRSAASARELGQEKKDLTVQEAMALLDELSPVYGRTP